MLNRIMLIIGVFIVVISTAFITPLSQDSAKTTQNHPPFLEIPTPWADSVFATLSPDERTAQLFMVAAYSKKGDAHQQKIEKLIKEYKIGGLIFMQGEPIRQAHLTNQYQSISKVPLMVAIDGEWGLAMRLDSTIKYPWQMTLGAIKDEQLIYQMGVDIGKQCKRLGIHVNFAPVIDINVNPKNPIINARSFGEDKINVANKGNAYMKGLQSVNVLANAKHFPGHGDTDKDSHQSLPIIHHTQERIDSVELYPFKQLINKGLGSIMVAHLYIPAFVKEKNTATTLSKEVVTNLLQDSLGFKGLIFTDALNMKGVSSYFDAGIVDVKALLAGNDVLLFSEDVPLAIKKINEAIIQGKISREEIDRRCLKILKAKEWQGLNNHQPVNLTQLTEELNNQEYEYLNKKLFEASLTVLENKNELIPLKRLDTLKIAALSITNESSSDFHEMLKKYSAVDCFSISEKKSIKTEKIIAKLRDYNTIIVSIHKSDKNPWKDYSIGKDVKEMLNKIPKGKNVILTVFANPYSLINVDEVKIANTLIMAYQNNTYAQQGAAKLIFGGIGANGVLPVSISEQYTAGKGLPIKSLQRFNYTSPLEVGIAPQDLYKIDSIANSGIQEGAYPGCQVFVAKSGQVIYNKSFGYHTYDKLIPVTDSTIYDLASITKIGATLLSLMKLQDEGKFSLNSILGDYLNELIPDSSPYYQLNLREILAHQAGLQAWVPFYIKTIRNGVLDTVIYRSDSSTYYPIRVAKNIYINKDYPKIIMQRILKGPLKKKEYRYSDLGYYFLKEIVEKQSHQKMEDFVAQIYAQMGMSTMGYFPRKRFNLNRIPPTENDKVFRKQLIHGDVHDPGAAMLGGVGGHAGLFSNANDLAKLMQMYLNKGTYGGQRFLSDSVLTEYTKCQFCADSLGNRRGAGFDKPVRNGEGGPTCNCVSYSSFGHSGFTGAIAWADPKEEVVYVFLSNRVYPDAENKKLLEMNIRTDIQQVIYEAINKIKPVN